MKSNPAEYSSPVTICMEDTKSLGNTRGYAMPMDSAKRGYYYGVEGVTEGKMW